MNIQNFILVLTIIFIIVIFILLPVGIKSPKIIEKGHDTGAPAQHYLGFKLIVALIISTLLTIIYAKILNL